MAKKKDKPQVINNIQELNLEIDYDKLAEAIVKTNNKIEAEANKKISESLTIELIDYTKAQAWNGELPTYMGSSTPVLDLTDTVE